MDLICLATVYGAQLVYAATQLKSRIFDPTCDVKDKSITMERALEIAFRGCYYDCEPRGRQVSLVNSWVLLRFSGSTEQTSVRSRSPNEEYVRQRELEREVDVVYVIQKNIFLWISRKYEWQREWKHLSTVSVA